MMAVTLRLLRVPSVELLSTSTTSISMPSIDFSSTWSMIVDRVALSLNAGTITESFLIGRVGLQRTKISRRLVSARNARCRRNGGATDTKRPSTPR